MLVTLLLSAVLMAALFLMLYAAVALVQDKRLFSSAPKEIRAVVLPKAERFPGARALGFVLLGVAVLLFPAAFYIGAADGVKHHYTFFRLFLRFAAMLYLLKAFDVLFFDYVLLCRSGFFSRYYPEVAPLVGPHLFGFNKKEHLTHALAFIPASLLMALLAVLPAR